MPPLCLTLAESSLSELESKLVQFHGRCELIEVRLDYLTEPAVPRLPGGEVSTLLATCRPLREGGRFSGSEQARLELLQRAARKGFGWIDLERDAGTLDLPGQTRVLRSHHNFDGFGDVRHSWKELRSSGGDAFKLAVQVSSTSELVELLRFMEERPAEEPRVVLGMGRHGMVSRILGAFLGNSWTYVSETEGSVVAPGQFSLDRAQSLFRLHAWNRTPDLFGVLGNPIEHSRSPQLLNPLFQDHRLEALYLPILLDDVNSWFEFLSSSLLPFRGFSVTIPFKFSVGEFCSENRSPIDSVNTLSRVRGKWLADNTDYSGFLKPLQARISSMRGKSAVVLGNGGVARTVVAALLGVGAEVCLVGRNAERVRDRSRQWGCSACTLEDLPLPADICVNTTPVGQYPNVEDSPLSLEQLDFSLVYDLIYNPARTKLLRLAEEREIATVSGVEMFVEQAAEQFRIWTGQDPDRSRMRSLLELKG